jgi:metal-sulfur cluster biosynthetic enzyme
MSDTLKLKIIDVLKQCYDPEIPVDLWNLGLIYSIDIIDGDENKSNISITMSLTTPGCSMGHHMSQDIETKVGAMEETGDVNVDVTFDPPWQPEMMTDEARTKLGFPPTQASPKPKESEIWE